MKKNPYDSDFFTALKTTSANSAGPIAKFIVDTFQPQSVVDFGCGNGEILYEISLLRQIECLGIEGPWVDFPQAENIEYINKDLTEHLSLDRKFDLAICLEVAEHLEERFAEILISNLTSSADIILFSAAIPGQGGTQHVNLQFPKYWNQLFAHKGFALFLDPREIFFKNMKIAPWYQQNALVYRKLDGGWKGDPQVEPKVMYHPLIFPKKDPLKYLLFRIKRWTWSLIAPQK